MFVKVFTILKFGDVHARFAQVRFSTCVLRSELVKSTSTIAGCCTSF